MPAYAVHAPAWLAGAQLCLVARWLPLARAVLQNQPLLACHPASYLLLHLMHDAGGGRMRRRAASSSSQRTGAHMCWVCSGASPLGQSLWMAAFLRLASVSVATALLWSAGKHLA